ncbi:MAG: type II secretion system F family protein [Bdellovibrionales bacterium]
MNINDLDDLKYKVTQLRFKSNRSERFRVYRKLQGMLAMNESLGRSLERLWYNVTDMGKYPDRPTARALREWLNKDRAGASLAEAMDGWVPMNELFMIRAGEESGAVARSLSVILEMGTTGKEMKQAIMQAVSYPIFMMLLLMAVLWMFGVNMIAPMKEFAPPEVVASMSGMVFVSDFIDSFGILVLLLFAGIIATIGLTLPYFDGALRIKLDAYPPWSWYRIWQGSAFLLSLSALLNANVPLKRGLEVLEEQATPWLKERIFLARQEVLRGRNLGEALRATHMNFPDPQVALDLEILAERADVADVMKSVTHDWMGEQIERLKRQAEVVRFFGLIAVGAVIAWAMLSIVGVTTQISNAGMS